MRIAYNKAKADFRRLLRLSEREQRDSFFRELDLAAYDSSKLLKIIRNANGQRPEATKVLITRTLDMKETLSSVYRLTTLGLLLLLQCINLVISQTPLRRNTTRSRLQTQLMIVSCLPVKTSVRSFHR